MALSFGPFFTCFIVTLFLTVYLHIIMHHTSVFHKRTIQFSLIGILVILIRMSIPFNFPFTYSFQSYQVLPMILDFTTQNIAGCRLRVDTLIFSIWFTVAFILLLRLLVQYIRLHHALSAFFVEKEGAYAYLYEFLQEYLAKPIRIALIPEPISPAITGLLHPILIMPDGQSFSETELKYICLHEIAHYKEHHLWLGFLMEIICRIHWWNPFVQHLKKEFMLFLELSNDFFLIQSNPKFSVTDYAELIVKTAKRIQSARLAEPSRMMHFAVNDTSVLSTRIYFILNNQENTSRFKRVHGYLCHTAIFAVVIFSVFCVPEPNFRELYPVTDGAVELREDNAYIIDHGTKQYTIYYEGRFFADIDHLSEDLKRLPRYKEGEPIHEND